MCVLYKRVRPWCSAMMCEVVNGADKSLEKEKQGLSV